MSESAKQIGRLHYFDPNTSIYENHEGTNSDSINFPLEDYSIAVDLQIKVNNRYSCGLGDITGESTIYEYSTENGTLSFLGGTDGVLTTNYTDIQMVNPTGNTNECLGIESITVSYDSWLHPTVNVKFVDVRGGTIMSPAEAHYFDESKRGNSYQIYKSLFSFPYPLFLLKIKGFYGRGVTYRLAVSKVDIDFDSNNGNFIIDVNFIGHIYGLFADIPMTYVAMAPFTTLGEQYWKKMVEDKKFWFCKGDSKGKEIYQCPMMTFPELALKAAEVAYSQPVAQIEADSETAMQSLDAEVQSLTSIIDSFQNAFENNAILKFFEDDVDNPTYAYIAYFGKDELYEDEIASGAIQTFVERLQSHDATYTKDKPYIGKFGNVDQILNDNKYDYFEFKIADEKPKEDYSIWTYWDYSLGTLIKLDKFRGKLDNNTYVDNFARKSSVINGINVDKFKLYVYDKGTSEKYRDIINNDIPEKIKSIKKTKEKVDREYKEKKNSFIENALGFRPSIKNLYDLAFAHLDTFMEVYYSVLKNIRDQLEGKSQCRLKSTYGITEGYTDTENPKKVSSNSNDYVRGDFLPPYTAFYKDWIDTGNGGEKKKTLMFPGELPNGDTDLLESKLVFDILTASKLYFKKSEDVTAAIEDFKVSGSTSIGGPSFSVKHFIPLTIYEIANNGRIKNPYESVAKKIERENISVDEILGDVYALFSLRLFYYLNSISEDGGNLDSNEAKFFGRLDAVNFFKAVGKSSSPVLKQFINKLADGSKEINDIKNFKTAIKNDNKTSITASWQIENSVNTNSALFIKSGGEYLYNYSKPKKNLSNISEFQNDIQNGDAEKYFRYFPIGLYDLNVLKNDFSNGYPLYKEGYITTIGKSFYSGTTNDTFQTGKTFGGGTFLLYEERDYIKKLYANIQNEVSNEEDSQNPLVDNTTFNVIRDGSTFNGFTNNIDSDFEIQIRSSAVVDEDNSSMGSDVISVGNMEAQRKYYIKHPETIDEFRTKSQINTSGEKINGSGAYCLLECPLYWMQTNNYAKAYLFLQGMPITEGYLGIQPKNNIVVQRASLLREGSFYWWEDNYDKDIVKTEGYCAFNRARWSGGTYDYEYYVHGTFKYRRPAKDETFISNFSWNASDGLNSLCDFETIDPIPDYDSPACKTPKYYKFPWYSQDTGFWGRDYSDKFKDISPSRRIYLKKYFEKWVEEEFSDFVDIYEDLRMYAPDSDGTRWYSEGLDITYCTNGSNVSGESDAVSNAWKLQDYLRKLFFGVCTIFDYYGGFYEKTNMSADAENFYYGFREFIDQLESIYGDMADAEQSDINLAFAIAEGEDPFKSRDLRLSTYETLKSLYDKWICASLKGEKTWRFARTDRFSKEKGTYELDNFIYMDSFFREIGYDLNVNLTKVVEWISKCLPSSSMNTVEGIMSYNGKNLYEYFTEIAQDCGGILLAVPQRYMFDTAKNIETVFTPIPACQDWDDDTYTYMFLYTYKPSEHLGDSDTKNIDMNGYSPDGDGFELTDEDIIGGLFDENEPGFAVPAFGVTFAKGNQAYFKKISLTTKQHATTEVGLNATFQIASKASETVRETTLYGQDIYKVYANNSYECTVEMMGDMQIFPPMYFQLNNIPMWKGAYLIKKVTHTIRPGDATTTIVGVRQNRYLLPFANSDIVSITHEGDSEGGNESSIGTQTSEGVPVSQSQNVVNQTPNHNIDIGVNENDFKSSNITKTNPLICLTPAHGPKTGKATECAWSTKLIDDYIIPKLRNRNPNFNIHRCNVGGANTNAKGYSMSETRKLINKYGSENVISVVPHWNGGKGYYFSVFYGKATDASDAYYREDSRRLAEFFRAEANKMVSGSSRYSKLPLGMLRLVKTENSGIHSYLLPPRNTDGAPLLNCACVLTENWFADFYPDGGGINYSSPNYTMLDNNGRYQNGRAWLESEEGYNAIADMHVEAIINYINSLGER